MTDQDRSRMVRNGKEWSGLVRIGKEQSGLVRTCQIWSRLARTDQNWSEKIRSSQDWSGMIRTGQEWSGLVKSGQGWSGMNMQKPLKTFEIRPAFETLFAFGLICLTLFNFRSYAQILSLLLIQSWNTSRIYRKRRMKKTDHSTYYSFLRWGKCVYFPVLFLQFFFAQLRPSLLSLWSHHIL